jgi:hypothetical protein
LKAEVSKKDYSSEAVGSNVRGSVLFFDTCANLGQFSLGQFAQGTLSFPDLGEPPFNGSTPLILYGHDCGVSVPFNVAVPADPTDPFLTNWLNRRPAGSHVTFSGVECQYPGRRVWKSTRGKYWNMLCSLGKKGTGHWARFTSSDPSLMHWTYSNRTFIEGALAGDFS